MREGAQAEGEPSRNLSATPPVAPGDILAGKYRVERVLGAGGMGVVVAATHIELLELRAIKFILPTQLGDAETVERFLREARATSRLKSEHVAKVHDVGRLDNGAPYMVMEYLRGADLRVHLKRRGAFPVHEAALYVLQACEALAEAHAAGIVHRDVKPENLFLTQLPDGTPSIKVLDFGISKVSGGGSADLSITSTTAIMGSPYYMSPEQLRSSRDVDSRADIWSLGVILYQLVTAKIPFQGKNITALIAAVIYGKITPPSALKPGVPEGLDKVVLRCLERELEHRYPSIAELAEDLLPFAPSVAGQSVDRIARLLRPNSGSRSGRALSGSYDAPVSIQPLTTPSGPPSHTASSEPSGEPPASAEPSSTPSLDEAHPTGRLGVSGTATRVSTLRSNDSSPGTLGDPPAATSGAWGPVVPSVRVVVEPSRTPVLILAAGAAIALVIAAAALLFGRSPPRHDDVAIGPSPSPSGASLPPPGASPAATTPTVSAASAGVAPPPAASSSVPVVAVPAPGTQHATGKAPSKPTATGTEPAKPPPTGDPFGAGRQ